MRVKVHFWAYENYSPMVVKMSTILMPLQDVTLSVSLLQLYCQHYPNVMFYKWLKHQIEFGHKHNVSAGLLNGKGKHSSLSCLQIGHYLLIILSFCVDYGQP